MAKLAGIHRPRRQSIRFAETRMSRQVPAPARRALPVPYDSAVFEHRRTGVFDDPTIDVFTDIDGTFAMLHPRPTVDYMQYRPRQEKLNLGAYKKSFDVMSRRFAKIADLFPTLGVAIDIGAADGAFLAKLATERPSLTLAAVEPDKETVGSRKALNLQGDYDSLDAARDAGAQADIAMMFHVFEHIDDPKAFIEQLRRILRPGGKIVIEVPSLDDPLLSLYRSKAYETFYFQRQHPFVYSRRSLERVLTTCGLRVIEMRPYQRYGLENHLGWLIHGKPGGDAALAAMFSGIDAEYRASLERSGLTDTVFAIAEIA
jgi:2-polyprenyl-3-methyl-5-hydroxy-6-metoxy-1,4-benzoquinol methylase